LEDLVLGSNGKVFNLAAQVWNHTFYWNSLCPNGGGAPPAELLTRIEQDFGSFAEFKKQFNEEATNHFGSGWAWLVLVSRSQNPKFSNLLFIHPIEE
jgi:superoxide dismutase, Fe-Mn family